MIKHYLMLILFFIVNQTLAQVVVSGKAIDSKTKEPLNGMNVYVNNTSIGTVTDSLGKFRLVVPGNGKIELVISHLVYEKKLIVVLPEKSENMLIEMNFQHNMLNQVVIKGKKPSKLSLANWTELFAVNLIGKYPGISARCRITNPEVLFFDYNKLSKQLQVFARRPLLIENTALGYLIRVELDEFIYSFETEEVVFQYSLFFENLTFPKSRMQQVEKTRKLLYAGSSMHFMRALYSNTLDDQGFGIYKFTSVQNLERQRVQKIIRERIEYNYANHNRPKVALQDLFTSKDTINYYRMVMLQQNYVHFDTVRLARPSVIKPNRGSIFVNFYTSDTLMVRYRGEDPTIAKKSAVVNELLNKTKQLKEPKKNKKFPLDWNSYMLFFNKEGINIQSNGYYRELGLFIYGDMGDRRLAGILPFDYNPNEEL
ncbi:carboxypeptidase-like regulatory domain-containing protein [Pedobacter sp. Du54]|uniref:carboxypeptidase-like regulatory domain-containing protein n=1 Tax=Pedobacter anseongensis TaxID=3133439 RepID=UPI0030B1F0A6